MKLRKLSVVPGTALLLVLAGCSGGSDGGVPGDTVELTLWTGFTGGDREAYEDLVGEFNATHDDIEVTMEVQPWDTIAQKLPAAWATGQGPDLATPSFDPNVLAEYAANGSLLEISDVGPDANQVNVDALAPAAIEAFTIDDSLLAVPANMATLQLYYNKELFAEAGIETPPADIEGLKQVATELTGDGIYGLSLADHETIQMWPLLQWLDGSDIVDGDGCSLLEEPEAIDSLTGWSELVENRVAPLGLTGAESDSLFSAGKAAMQLNGPWAAPAYEEAGIDLGIAPVPTGVDGPVSLASTVPLAASAQTEHPEEVQEFMAWWTGQDAQQQFALQSGFPPVRTDMTEDPKLSQDDVVSKFAAAVPFSRLYLAGVPNAQQVDAEIYTPLIGKITRGEDVADAAAEASGKIGELTGCEG